MGKGCVCGRRRACASPGARFSHVVRWQFHSVVVTSLEESLTRHEEINNKRREGENMERWIFVGPRCLLARSLPKLNCRRARVVERATATECRLVAVRAQILEPRWYARASSPSTSEPTRRSRQAPWRTSTSTCLTASDAASRTPRRARTPDGRAGRVPGRSPSYSHACASPWAGSTSGWSARAATLC